MLKRLWGALLLVALFVLSTLPAAAQTDVVRELEATYRIQADGSVDVEWVLDWDFGETGRRGIIIDVLIREPWENDDDYDVVYEVADVQVSSPTGAPETFTTSTVRDGEYQLMEIRVGDPNETLDESRHTYVISYSLEGALRTFDARPEFFWDITSTQFPRIDAATVTVESAGGVTQARCLVDERDCESTVDGGVATYQVAPVPEGDILSVVARLEPGQVANAEPTLEQAVRPLTPLQRLWEGIKARPIVSLGIGAIIVAILGSFVRSVMPVRDERYEGVPPGVINRGGPTTKKKFSGAIPVRFEPPEASLSEAGMALHGRYDPSHLAANIVQMASQGALDISTEPLSISRGAQPADEADPAQTRIWQLADKTGHKVATDDSVLQRMTNAVQSHQKAEHDPLLQPGKAATGGNRKTPMLLWIVLVFGFVFASRAGFNVTPYMFPIIVLFMLGRLAMVFLGGSRRKRGAPLTAKGSAIKDQTLGFRQYIETAEAAQLNFEANQDIFRRYLPWAVLFGLTDRWTKVCEDLARMGRIAPVDYSFMGGARTSSDFSRRINTVTARSTSIYRAQQRAEAAARRSSSSSYGGGSGGRSGFSGGSRGGGGGGGSRGRSW